jgi:predicted pyridoxine 5'-phosphate oxidase superfamily flavin-nucleotide-binding protein
MVWDDDHLMFADIRSPRTVANLRHNPAVEINVVDPILRKGYRFKGTATVLSEGELFERALDLYKQRGSTNPIRNIVLVKVERALPVVSPAYDMGATEEEVSARWRSYWANLEREGGDTSAAVEASDL